MNFRNIGFGLAAFALGAAAWTAGAAAFGPAAGSRKRRRPAAPTAAPLGLAGTGKHVTEGTPNPAAEHVPTDLMGDTHPGNDSRAVAAFRPDPTAVPTAAEREALRPATGPAPTLVADRGSGFGEAAGAA